MGLRRTPLSETLEVAVETLSNMIRPHEWFFDERGFEIQKGYCSFQRDTARLALPGATASKPEGFFSIQ